jgi:hypothetical protein
MSILVNNVTYTDASSIANKFNEFFTNIATEICDSIHPADLPPNYFDPDPASPVFDFDSAVVSELEISEAIDQLQIKKNLDCNGLSTLILSKMHR